MFQKYIVFWSNCSSTIKSLIINEHSREDKGFWTLHDVHCHQFLTLTEYRAPQLKAINNSSHGLLEIVSFSYFFSLLLRYFGIKKGLKANNKVYFPFKNTEIKCNLQLRWMFLFFSPCCLLCSNWSLLKQTLVQILIGVTIKAEVIFFPKGTADYLPIYTTHII